MHSIPQTPRSRTRAAAAQILLSSTYTPLWVLIGLSAPKLIHVQSMVRTPKFGFVSKTTARARLGSFFIAQPQARKFVSQPGPWHPLGSFLRTTCRQPHWVRIAESCLGSGTPAAQGSFPLRNWLRSALQETRAPIGFVSQRAASAPRSVPPAHTRSAIRRFRPTTGQKTAPRFRPNCLESAT